jgi:adenylate cyclase
VHEVRFQRRSDGETRLIRLQVPEGATLLDAAREVGLPIAQACDSGGLCAGCALRVLEGARFLSEESPDEAAAKERNRVLAGQRLACQCRVHGPVLVTASYW